MIMCHEGAFLNHNEVPSGITNRNKSFKIPNMKRPTRQQKTKMSYCEIVLPWIRYQVPMTKNQRSHTHNPITGLNKFHIVFGYKVEVNPPLHKHGNPSIMVYQRLRLIHNPCHNHIFIQLNIL